jgi:hypothetical protein
MPKEGTSGDSLQYENLARELDVETVAGVLARSLGI